MDGMKRVIIRLRVPASEPEVTNWLAMHGIAIRHIYRLMNAIAIEATEDQLRGLGAESWVTSIEEDRTVRTQDGEA
jgi:hypothetical protein